MTALTPTFDEAVAQFRDAQATLSRAICDRIDAVHGLREAEAECQRRERVFEETRAVLEHAVRPADSGRELRPAA
jgi:hypothetical protein